MNNQTAISYNTGLIIKALAVLLMVFHHCFGFPTWYINMPDFFSYTRLVELAKESKICVSLFAFITGWFYFHHHNKSFGYSIRKILSLLLNYWIVILPISVFSFFFSGYRFTPEFFFELIPLRQSQNLLFFSWYVWFYALMMLAFCLFGLINKQDKSAVAVLAFRVLFISILLFAYFSTSWKFHIFWQWYPTAIGGYLFAKFRIFELCIAYISSQAVAAVLALVLISASFYLYGHFEILLGAETGYLSAPLFILGILVTLSKYRMSVAESILQFIGKHSMNIWFLHCVFFSPVTRQSVQQSLFLSHNPVLIFCIVFFFSLFSSVLISPIQKKAYQHMLKPLFAKLGW